MLQESFYFSENFLRVTLPSSDSVIRTLQDTMQDTLQDKELLKVFTGVHSRSELQEILGLSDRENFRRNYLQQLKFIIIFPFSTHEKYPKKCLTFWGMSSV